jgi:hypothetical protein
VAPVNGWQFAIPALVLSVFNLIAIRRQQRR